MDSRNSLSLLAFLGWFSATGTGLFAQQQANNPAPPASAHHRHADLVADTFSQIAGYESLRRGAAVKSPQASSTSAATLIPPPRGDAAHATFEQPPSRQPIPATRASHAQAALFVDSPIAAMRLIMAEEHIPDNEVAEPTAMPTESAQIPSALQIPHAPFVDDSLESASSTMTTPTSSAAIGETTATDEPITQPQGFVGSTEPTRSASARGGQSLPLSRAIRTARSKRNLKTSFVEMPPSPPLEIASTVEPSSESANASSRDQRIGVSWDADRRARRRSIRAAEFAALDDPISRTLDPDFDLANRSGAEERSDATSEQLKLDFLDGPGGEAVVIEAAKSLLDDVEENLSREISDEVLKKNAANSETLRDNRNPLLDVEKEIEANAADAKYDYEQYLTDEIQPTPVVRPKQNYAYTLADVLDDRNEQPDSCIEQQFCDAMWQCAGGKSQTAWQRLQREWGRNYAVIHRGSCGGMGFANGGFGLITPIQIGSSLYSDSSHGRLLGGGWGSPIRLDRASCTLE